MKSLSLAVAFLFCLMLQAVAEPAGVQWSPFLKATGCPVVIEYAESPFPESPYPSGNYVRVPLADNAGYLNVMNFEILTSYFRYNPTIADCDVQIGPVPKQPKQGFYCYLGMVTGIKAPFDGDFTQIMGRTAGAYIKLTFYGADAAWRHVKLSDLCRADGCTIQIQGTCIHWTPD